MGTFSADLKSEREKRKISLSQIAAETRISLRHLESLEEGRFADLPGGIYARAFLKAYCEILKLDSQDIMQRYEAEVIPLSEKPLKTRVQIPKQSSTFVIHPYVVWGLLLLISGNRALFQQEKDYCDLFSLLLAFSRCQSLRIGSAGSDSWAAGTCSAIGLFAFHLHARFRRKCICWAGCSFSGSCAC